MIQDRHLKNCSCQTNGIEPIFNCIMTTRVYRRQHDTSIDYRLSYFYATSFQKLPPHITITICNIISKQHYGFKVLSLFVKPGIDITVRGFQLSYRMQLWTCPTSNSPAINIIMNTDDIISNVPLTLLMTTTMAECNTKYAKKFEVLLTHQNFITELLNLNFKIAL